MDAKIKKITIRQYESADREAWDAFVNAFKTPMFMFNRGFMEYHADRFEDASLLFFKDDALVAVLPASRHGDELRSHGGLTYGGLLSGPKMRQVTMLDCFAALRDFCRERGVTSVVILFVRADGRKAHAGERDARPYRANLVGSRNAPQNAKRSEGRLRSKYPPAAGRPRSGCPGRGA